MVNKKNFGVVLVIILWLIYSLILSTKTYSDKYLTNIYWENKFKELNIKDEIDFLSQKIIDWARSEVENKTTYKDWYYAWWYPPEEYWVCTDVVWRALKNAWINLKSEIDKDIKNNLSSYPRVNYKPDKNIDFRRVPNLKVYFDRYYASLTIKVLPWNKENLEKWKPWDIVVFWKPHNHVWIISDKRSKYWVPLMIHNSAPVAKENDSLYYWDKNLSKIIWHYRVK